MKTREALAIWDNLFPEIAEQNLYPQPWVVRMWCRNYTTEELEYAATTARIAVSNGKITDATIDNLSKYMSGIMRHKHADDAETTKEIDNYIADRNQSGELHV
jgi:hypothetical protein